MVNYQLGFEGVWRVMSNWRNAARLMHHQGVAMPLS